MYVCMYVCVCVCVCVYAYMYVCMYVFCLYVCIYHLIAGVFPGLFSGLFPGEGTLIGIALQGPKGKPRERRARLPRGILRSQSFLLHSVIMKRTSQNLMPPRSARLGLCI